MAKVKIFMILIGAGWKICVDYLVSNNVAEKEGTLFEC